MEQSTVLAPCLPALEGLSDFTAGRACRAWQYMGAHPAVQDGKDGVLFRCWAPHAVRVSVMGDFNDWQPDMHPLTREGNGIWSGFVPALPRYASYQFSILTTRGRRLAKADSFAFHAETRPGTASKYYDLSGYLWQDDAWCQLRRKLDLRHQPVNIYELHLGSWQCTEDGYPLDYRSLADALIPYVKQLSFTHVEFLPVSEHPLDDSWGYQCTGYFAVTSRFGTPYDFMFLIDRLHQAGIGVILDWTPAHFPKDAFGLYEFDGAPLYESADPYRREHAAWGTRIFDYGKPEVASFLTSAALFWLEVFHADGLRVDAVASMLYLDYGRQNGQWRPNRYGGKEHLEAIRFLKHLTHSLNTAVPDALIIAEESTAWPRVTRETTDGGLGFQLKWNMGWMNDFLHYIALDPYFRQFHHKDITFSFFYAFSEQFLLPLSHDEMVHGKASFLSKMPGTPEQKFAGVRVFYTYMLTHPGKKLLFMGAEFGQWREWRFAHPLDWFLLEHEPHRQLQAFFGAANAFYLHARPLWEEDFSWNGFAWLCPDDAQANCIAFLRKDSAGRPLVVLCNFSPVDRSGYRVGLPSRGLYREVFNSDAAAFGGSDLCNSGILVSQPIPCHGQAHSVALKLPPLSAVILQPLRK